MHSEPFACRVRGKRGSLPAGRTRAGDARGLVWGLLKEQYVGAQVYSVGAITGRLISDRVTSLCILTSILV